MNEIKRLQQLAGIITEIKINNPNITPQKVWDLYNKLYVNEGEDHYDVAARDILDDNIPPGFNWEDYEDGYKGVIFDLDPQILKTIYNELEEYSKNT